MLTALFVIGAVAALFGWRSRNHIGTATGCDRNIIYGADGDIRAVYVLPPIRTKYLGENTYAQGWARNARLLLALRRDVRFLSLPTPIDPDEYRLRAGAHANTEKWRARVDLQAEFLSYLTTAAPVTYLCVSLKEQRPTSFVSAIEYIAVSLFEGISRLSGSVSGRAAMPFREQMRRIERKVAADVVAHGGWRPEHEEALMILERNKCRGITYPKRHKKWAEQIERDVEIHWADNKNKASFKEIDLDRLYHCHTTPLDGGKHGLKVQSAYGTGFQRAYHVGVIPDQPLDDCDLFAGWLEDLPFDVDVAIDVTVMPNTDTQRELEQHAHKFAEAYREEYENSPLGPTDETVELPALLEQLLTDLKSTKKPPMFKVVATLLVGGLTEEELDECDVSIEKDSPFNCLTLEACPDQPEAIWKTFTPAGKSKIRGFDRRMTAVGIGLTGISGVNVAGPENGFVIGHQVAKRQLPVKLHLRTGVENNRPPTTLLVGETGCGKTTTALATFCLPAYEQGDQVVILNPKGGDDHKIADLPTVDAGDVEHVVFDESMVVPGQVDPLRIAPRVTAASDAAAFFAALLNVTGSRLETYLLGAAQDELDEMGDEATSTGVIARLKRSATSELVELGNELEIRSRSPIARAGFAVPGVDLPALGTKPIVIINMQHLTISDTDRAHWTLRERENDAVTRLIFVWAENLTSEDNRKHKLLYIDECDRFAVENTHGFFLINDAQRRGRSRNVTTVLAMQKVKDLEKLRGQNGTRMVYRSNDDEEADNGAALLGLFDADNKIREEIKALGDGECFMRDHYGAITKLHIDHIDQRIFDVLNNTPSTEPALA